MCVGGGGSAYVCVWGACVCAGGWGSVDLAVRGTFMCVWRGVGGGWGGGGEAEGPYLRLVVVTRHDVPRSSQGGRLYRGGHVGHQADEEGAHTHLQARLDLVIVPVRKVRHGPRSVRQHLGGREGGRRRKGGGAQVARSACQTAQAPLALRLVQTPPPSWCGLLMGIRK